MKSIYPGISIVMATYNSQRTIDRSLGSIAGQIYPKDQIEIIIADGGSKDKTLAIAKKYKAKIIHVDQKKQNAELNKSLGIQAAKNEILIMIDHDNILPNRNWIKHMVQPFLEHKEVIGVETLRYAYDPNTSLLDRYFALFGVGDPIVWYLGRADRLSYIYDRYNLAGKAKDVGKYYLVKFKPDRIPTIGANGFAVRRELLMKNADAAPGRYFDMDVNADLIKKGFNTYAFIKDSILHLTGYGSIWYFLKRRMLFIDLYRFGEKGVAIKKIRRYSGYEKQDIFKLLWFIVISLTFIVPLIDSIRGWRKIHDSAWFLHPIMCFSFVIIYSWVIIKHQFNLYLTNSG